MWNLMAVLWKLGCQRSLLAGGSICLPAPGSRTKQWNLDHTHVSFKPPSLGQSALLSLQQQKPVSLRVKQRQSRPDRLQTATPAPPWGPTAPTRVQNISAWRAPPLRPTGPEPLTDSHRTLQGTNGRVEGHCYGGGGHSIQRWVCPQIKDAPIYSTWICGDEMIRK